MTNQDTEGTVADTPTTNPDVGGLTIDIADDSVAGFD